MSLKIVMLFVIVWWIGIEDHNMFFSPEALKQPHEHYNDSPARAEKGRLVNVPRRKRRRLPAPRFLLTLLSK